MHLFSYWNHNAAYYPWVKKQLQGCHRILDVGCGDGTLVRYLDLQGYAVAGIDISPDCIGKAREFGIDGKAEFILGDFTQFRGAALYDGIVFVASLHHMEMSSALEKAVDLLAEGGKLLVVGLASPSGPADRFLEICRVIPAWIGSRLHRMVPAEDLGIPVCRKLPEMAEVRETVRRLLPGATLRRGLYWRYLLCWQK